MLAYDWNFLGLSTETKPMAGEKVVDGSTFYECDTSSFFIFYHGEWYQQTFVTEDGINFWLYKALMKKMFGKLFDSNISKGKIIKPTTGTEIEFTTNQIAQITDLTGYGDTFQQTYSGKNLFDRANASENTVLIWVSGADNAENGTLVGPYIDVNEGDKFISNYTVLVFFYDSSSNYLGVLQDDEGTVAKRAPLNAFSPKSFTVPNGLSIAKMRIEYRKNKGDNPEDMVVVNDIMLNSGETLLPYEPYVGGTASPNPDYPQAVNVVTGTQTVTINEEQSYTIDLGSIELCKLGDYQDYIYKSGDDWYVHKSISKVILTGNETWIYSNSNYFRTENITDAFVPTQAGDLSPIISDYFESKTPATIYNGYVEYGVSLNTGVSGIRIRHKDYNTTSNFRNWLGSHNTTAYYALATPTDTKITDTTLISNLNSLLNHMFPAGDHQIVITADELPIALKLTITEKE